MAAQAKTRTKPIAAVSAVADPAPIVAPAPHKAESKLVHAMLNELFVALKLFGACESAKIVTLFHRLKLAT